MVKKIRKNEGFKKTQKEGEKISDVKIMMTPKELAEYLNMGLTRVYELIKLPDFPKVKVKKKYYIITYRLQEWLESKIGEDNIM